MKLIPKFVDPVEEAVGTLVNGGHLTNAMGYIPILRLEDIQEGDRLPVITCETLDLIVEEDGINASTGYLLTIWDYFPDRDECQAVEDIQLLAVQIVKAYSEDLLEISNILGGEDSDKLFPKADYTTQGKRVILPRYKGTVFSSKVDAKNSPLKDRLLGATLQGRLEGVIDYICCSKSSFNIPE